MIKFFGASACAAFIALSPAAAQQTAPATMAPAVTPAAGGTIAAVIKAQTELSTFAQLATAAGFDTTFGGAGPLTVLAPSNAAFAKLPAAEVEALKKPENVQRLQQVLLYHVIPAAADSAKLKGTAGNVPSAQGGATLKVDGTGAAIKVNGATVTRADVGASNGTIHIIDTVLVPGAAPASAPAAAPAPAASN